MAILNLGVTAARSKAPPRWNVNGDGLDTVTIEMDVAATGLTAYLASLTKWSPCPLDGNLFLSDWDNDNDRQYPTVSLRYTGFRNGTLPSNLATKSISLQTSAFDHVYSEESEIHAEVQYYATSITHVFWSIGPPGEVTIGLTTDPVYFYGTFSGRNLAIPPEGISIMDLFSPVNIQSELTSEEIIPGHYLRNQVTVIRQLRGIY